MKKTKTKGKSKSKSSKSKSDRPLNFLCKFQQLKMRAPHSPPSRCFCQKVLESLVRVRGAVLVLTVAVLRETIPFLFCCGRIVVSPP